MELKKTGVLIAQARKERNLTQREVADALHVTVQAVSKWERGLSCPDVHLLEPLSEVLGLTVSDLLLGKQQKKNDFMKKEEIQPALSVKEVLRLLLSSLVIAAFCYLFDVSDREGILPIIHLAPFLFHFLCLLFGTCYSVRQSKDGAYNACHCFWRTAFVLGILWLIFMLLWTNEGDLFRLLADRIFGNAWNDQTQKMTAGLFIGGFIRVRVIDYAYFSGLLLCFTSYVAAEWIIDQKNCKKEVEGGTVDRRTAHRPQR